MNSNETDDKKPFKSKVGGQALIEGIMMRGTDTAAMACRLPDGTIDVETWAIRNGKNAPWYTKVPFIRGIFNFGGSLYDGIKCMMRSAEKQVTDDDEEENPEEMNRLEKWLSEKLDGEHGKEILNTIFIVTAVIAMVIAVCVIKFVPAALSSLLKYAEVPEWGRTVSEGVLKIAIIVTYMWAISNMGEIHTTFMYHGAEHKTIFCHEAQLELTVENVRRQSRFHPRCGTSFILIVALLSICVGMFLPWDNIWKRFALQLLLLLPEAGIGYELIRIAGKYDNPFTKVLSAPGLWLQRITTKEPTDKMIEVAIAAIKPVIPKDKSEDKW